MTSRRFLFALCMLCTPALAADPAPWQTAGAIAKATDADIVKAGIHGIDSHVTDLEKALADGAADFPPRPDADGKVIALTDGPTETLMVLAMAAKAQQATTALANPYPEIGLALALYYNEVHKPEEALRVLDATFKLKVVQGTFLGVRDASMLTEQATAYAGLKRWSDALASADAALKASQNDRDRARSHRTRGFNLTELGRLDEAETAYGNSLKLEPNNPLARNELAYIAKLRAGGTRAPTEQVVPKTSEPAPPAKPPI